MVCAGAKGISHSIDVDTIKLVDGHWEAVVFTMYNKPQSIPGVPKFQATISKLFFRCSEITGSLASLIFFQDLEMSPSTAKNFNYLPEWKPVDPATDIGKVWKYVCTQGYKKNR
jgi:hypothetical protein